ncbi:hypothetical protein DPMN_001205 [Dreissena polymorpha]|uniref:Uncharacterized protein n=1 Tax=Dreissena polymorpha TaxID=45954 RepID=A0A9D4MGV9_DREPO|nr:hypothetical protein DPMN_001205 [Dreissena polymorpha]
MSLLQTTYPRQPHQHPSPPRNSTRQGRQALFKSQVHQSYLPLRSQSYLPLRSQSYLQLKFQSYLKYLKRSGTSLRL